MAKTGSVKANNAGLPADRRETKMSLVGNAPHTDVPLAGSGYTNKWSKQAATVPGAGKISSSKANGGTITKGGTKRK